MPKTGRLRLPLMKAELTGDTLKHPERYANRKGPKRTRPVGKPYANMTAEECLVWDELVNELPWLHSAHRMFLRLCAHYGARLNHGAGLSLEAAKFYASLLSKLGATPTSETNVSHPDDAGEEGDFFSRH